MIDEAIQQEGKKVTIEELRQRYLNDKRGNRFRKGRIYI